MSSQRPDVKAAMREAIQTISYFHTERITMQTFQQHTTHIQYKITPANQVVNIQIQDAMLFILVVLTLWICMVPPFRSQSVFEIRIALSLVHAFDESA
jgi:hypothetical protein